MKKLILSIVLLFAGICSFAQQDPQFTQNMFNGLFFNPGSAGHNGGICGTLLTRQQWVGFEGNPQTHLFSGDARFGDHGVGLTVFQDNLGVENTFTAKVAYAYHLAIPSLPGKLGIGVELGFLSRSFNNNFIARQDITLDPTIPNINTSANAFDAGAGLYYYTKKLYIGISALHLPQSTFTDEGTLGNDTTAVGDLDFKQVQNYYITAGYEFPITSSGAYVLKPSFLAKTDGSSAQLDVNLLLEYNKMLLVSI